MADSAGRGWDGVSAGGGAWAVPLVGEGAAGARRGSPKEEEKEKHLAPPTDATPIFHFSGGGI